MDDHSRSCSSHTTSCQLDQDQFSFLLGHQIPTICSSSSLSAAFGVESLSLKGEGQMPLSSCYSTPGAGGGEDSGAGNGFRAVGSLGVVDHQGSLLHGSRMKSVEQEFDSLDCESEEGLEVSEVPAKPVPARSSGSKRSRAAEVHNMSEKRRRSRINEKMKALQNLIPNSNKTDKASMLDEAIEYLKQLQLQVQMLSMRNGLNLHPLYLSGAMQPLQASQLYFGLGVDGDRAINIGMGTPPLNQDSAAQSSFEPSSQSTSSHHSTTISNIANMTTIPGTLFVRESLQSNHGSFRLPESSEDIFSVSLVTQQQLATGQPTRNLTENEMSSMAINAAQQFGVQASSLVAASHLEESMLGRETSQGVLPKEPENQILIQHLHGMQAGRTFSGTDMKEESEDF